MINGKKLIVVLPAYNAAKTLEKTYREIPMDIVDEVILVDDDSVDSTVETGRNLGITQIIKHDRNRGYGGNQKTCYDRALELGADIIVMLHPDYQYTPKLIPAMTSLIAQDIHPVVFGSRILGKGALDGGMPWYKYVANRLLTLMQNILLGQKLSEYHTGYRAYSADVLRTIDYHRNSENFVFDNEVVSQIFMAGFPIGEVTCPTLYFDDASSIRMGASIRYGLGVIRVSIQHALHQTGLVKNSRYGGR
jgi:glycosyltransferase involved in cell wall biosynthesis